MRTAIVLLAFVTGTTQAATFTDFGSFQSATRGLAVETFDSAPWPAPITGGLNGQRNLGITWDSAADLGISEFAVLSGTSSLADFDVSPFDPDDMIFAELPPGITAVGGFVSHGGSSIGASNVTLEVFDIDGNSLKSVNTPNQEEFSFIGVTTLTPIGRASFFFPGPEASDDFVLDDFHFGRRVPEPSVTNALVGLALVGLLIAKTRIVRRASKA